VAFNVSKEYLTNLRSQCMRVICNLKADQSQPIIGMFAKKSQLKQEASTSSEAGGGEPAEKRQKIE